MHVCRSARRDMAVAIGMAIAGTVSANVYSASTEAELTQAINSTNAAGSPGTVNITADIALTDEAEDLGQAFFAKFIKRAYHAQGPCTRRKTTHTRAKVYVTHFPHP